MTQGASLRLAEVLIPRALSSSGPRTRNGSVGRVTTTSKQGVWGWERERLRRGRGECGKEPDLTQQVLGSPRLPVSHPQTRPNQSTGPQAHKHMLRHTAHTDTQTPAQTHRVTRAQNQTHTLTQTDTVRHRELHTLRDTADTRVTRTHTHTDTVTHAPVNTCSQYTQSTHSSPPPLEICLHLNADTHVNAHLSYPAPRAAPTGSHLPDPPQHRPILTQGMLPPERGQRRVTALEIRFRPL